MRFAPAPGKTRLESRIKKSTPILFVGLGYSIFTELIKSGGQRYWSNTGNCLNLSVWHATFDTPDARGWNYIVSHVLHRTLPWIRGASAIHNYRQKNLLSLQDQGLILFVTFVVDAAVGGHRNHPPYWSEQGVDVPFLQLVHGRHHVRILVEVML